MDQFLRQYNRTKCRPLHVLHQTPIAAPPSRRYRAGVAPSMILPHLQAAYPMALEPTRMVTRGIKRDAGPDAYRRVSQDMGIGDFERAPAGAAGRLGSIPVPRRSARIAARRLP